MAWCTCELVSVGTVNIKMQIPHHTAVAWAKPPGLRRPGRRKRTKTRGYQQNWGVHGAHPETQRQLDIRHSATAGYPARGSGSKLLDFDGEIARLGMASCLITAISPSDTVEHIASYGILDAAMRRYRLRNRSQNGAERRRRQPRWRLIQYPRNALVNLVN